MIVPTAPAVAIASRPPRPSCQAREVSEKNAHGCEMPSGQTSNPERRRDHDDQVMPAPSRGRGPRVTRMSSAGQSR